MVMKSFFHGAPDVLDAFQGEVIYDQLQCEGVICIDPVDHAALSSANPAVEAPWTAYQGTMGKSLSFAKPV